jgi:pimeloyl-ACP methyl ester carboxylesterase
LNSNASYSPLRTPRHESLRVRGLNLHVTRWGPAPSKAQPPIFMLHGWLDASDTFQFVVDNLAKDWPVVAPDWRGFGRSEWPQEGYVFPDYLGDLEALLDQIAPDAPVPLVGHSMGGNIANLYAGLRPERVRSIVNLEGLGLPRVPSSESPKRMRRWLDQIKSPAIEKSYDSFEQFEMVIQHRYPRFAPQVTRFVARVWGKQEADGRVRQSSDPRHHWVNPIIYKREDAEATWREIKAPLLLLLGQKSEFLPRLGADGTDDALRTTYPGVEIKSVPEAGHMLHIERPAAVAPLIEAFLDAH